MEWKIEFTLYELIGMIVVWLGFIYAILKFGWSFLELIIEILKDYSRTMWYFIEFILYRKRFLEFMKDKPRSKGPRKRLTPTNSSELSMPSVVFSCCPKCESTNGNIIVGTNKIQCADCFDIRAI